MKSKPNRSNLIPTFLLWSGMLVALTPGLFMFQQAHSVVPNNTSWTGLTVALLIAMFVSGATVVHLINFQRLSFLKSVAATVFVVIVLSLAGGVYGLNMFFIFPAVLIFHILLSVIFSQIRRQEFPRTIVRGTLVGLIAIGSIIGFYEAADWNSYYVQGELIRVDRATGEEIIVGAQDCKKAAWYGILSPVARKRADTCYSVRARQQCNEKLCTVIKSSFQQDQCRFSIGVFCPTTP